MRDNLVKFPSLGADFYSPNVKLCFDLKNQPVERESLNSIFGRITTQVSQMKRPRHLPGGIEMLWQLPEMVHSLQKELFFYPPEEMVPKNHNQVLKVFTMKIKSENIINKMFF